MPGWKITPLGAILLALFVAGLVALFSGSAGFETAGFIVVILVILFVGGDRMSARFGRYGSLTQGRADTRTEDLQDRDEP